jgi:hypothetical protein
MAKWILVLRAAQRYIRQLPSERLVDRAIDNRDRSIRLLSHHVFRVGEAFLETVLDGVEYRTNNANIPPADGTCAVSAEIASYGDSIVNRLESWWAELKDKSCRHPVKTFSGAPPTHQLFERSVWHSAQHTRQLMAILERFGIEPEGPLTADDLAGLPLPQGLWE